MVYMDLDEMCYNISDNGLRFEVNFSDIKKLVRNNFTDNKSRTGMDEFNYIEQRTKLVIGLLIDVKYIEKVSMGYRITGQGWQAIGRVIASREKAIIKEKVNSAMQRMLIPGDDGSIDIVYVDDNNKIWKEVK